MGHYVIECTAKCFLLRKIMRRGRQEARHEHIQFAEVKRARDADFGTHDYAFFAEVGSSNRIEPLPPPHVSVFDGDSSKWSIG